MAQNSVKPCGNTVGVGVGEAILQMDVWQRAARRQAEATSRAAAAAEAIMMIWSKLPEEIRQKIEEDCLIRERIRAVTGFYGFNCS